MEKAFLEAIRDGGLVGDGAMGSALYERGVFVNRNFDEVNLLQPELVYGIHRQYLEAGAHLLESNTYGANRIRLAGHGLEDRCVAINQTAMDILRRAAGGAAYLGGAIGPTGLNAGQLRRREQQVRRAFSEQAGLLAESGADVLVIETFLQPHELRMAVESARAATEIPIIAQVAVTPEGTIVDNTPPEALAEEIVSWGANVVGANCNGPGLVLEVVTKMLGAGVPVCAMPNAGRPQTVEDRQIYLATPENFGVYARRMFKAGIKLVGGCCGTGPNHIRRVSSAARMVWPRQDRALVELAQEDIRQPPRPLAQRSKWGAKLGKRFVVSVEVNPGAGLSTDRQVEAARMLVEHGADTINIADGPRATVRMSNLALGLAMQQALDCQVLLHLCCRDRNFLALQATALGAHAMGFRNLVVITGDPPKVGDYPDATAVYDVDSIGLLRMLHNFNSGVDPSGKRCEQTDFVLATGVEPAAQDFEREMLRLRQKVEAGANAIMTQPIYNPEHLERFLEASRDIDVPVLVGLLPLASYRNAEFIHNNIPGMSIPTNILERMRKADKGAGARAEGVTIAVESLRGVRDRVAGAYIMPPLGRYEMAAQIIAALGEDRSLGPAVPGALSSPPSGKES